MISYLPFNIWFISNKIIISSFDILLVVCLEHFLLRCCYFQVVSLLISFTVGEMIHLVKTKTIQVFFEKIAVSGDFHSSLPLLTMIRIITKTDHRSYSSKYQKGCVVVSFEVNRRCSVLFHSLIDCWTHFNNLRLLIVARSIFFLSL